MKVCKCDKLTMEAVAEYESVRECAERERVPHTTVEDNCLRRRVNRGRFVYRYAEDVDPLESFEGKRGRPVTVENLRTGETMDFYNVYEAAERFYAHPVTVRRHLVSGKPLFRDWAVRYAR